MSGTKLIKLFSILESRTQQIFCFSSFWCADIYKWSFDFMMNFKELLLTALCNIFSGRTAVISASSYGVTNI